MSSPRAAYAFPVAALAECAHPGIGDSFLKGDQVTDIQADFHEYPLSPTFGAADAGISRCSGVERSLNDGEANETLFALWAMCAAEILADKKVKVQIAGEKMEDETYGDEDNHRDKDQEFMVHHISHEESYASGRGKCQENNRGTPKKNMRWRRKEVCANDERFALAVAQVIEFFKCSPDFESGDSHAVLLS